MDYWAECVNEAFEDAGITATKEQTDTVISWVEGAHENYGMSHGHDCIPDPRDTELDNLKAAHKKEVERLENRELCYQKSVAQRRNVPVGDVYLDDYGTVRYDRR